MSPDSFTFKLTVPNDPEGVVVLAAVTMHAVGYANLDAAVGAAFVERVRDLARQSMASSTGKSCLVVIAAADGQLTVTMGGQSASQPLPA